MSFFQAIVRVRGSPAIFEAAGRSYDVDSILRATDFRSELLSFWSHWQETIQKVDLASERGIEADPAVLESLANEFRYQRDLITAEECERWLAARGVAPDDFLEHFVRCCLAEQPALEVFSEDTAERASEEEMQRLFRVDWVLSDEFDRAARQLAWRVALDCENQTNQSTEGTARVPGALNRGAHQVVDFTPAELMELHRLESAFRTRCQGLLTGDSRKPYLESLRLPLTWFKLELMELDNVEAAREAFLCVQEDGMTLAKVAAVSGYTLRKMDALLEELPPSWQLPLLTARTGTVLPPFASDEGAQVCLVEAKGEPTINDPRVRERVDTMILQQHFGALESRHVQWRTPIMDSA